MTPEFRGQRILLYRTEVVEEAIEVVEKLDECVEENGDLNMQDKDLWWSLSVLAVPCVFVIIVLVMKLIELT